MSVSNRSRPMPAGGATQDEEDESPCLGGLPRVVEAHLLSFLAVADVCAVLSLRSYVEAAAVFRSWGPKQYDTDFLAEVGSLRGTCPRFRHFDRYVSAEAPELYKGYFMQASTVQRAFPRLLEADDA